MSHVVVTRGARIPIACRRAAAIAHVGLSLSLSLLLSGCGSGRTTCDLDAVVRQSAGVTAVDCGRVAAGASSTATDQCIADQTRRAAPFLRAL